MPTETRHISFDLEEVSEALLDLRRRSGKPLPEGSVVDHVLEWNDVSKHVKFKLHIARDDGRLDKFNAGHSELGAALIYYCRKKKIPLPIRATKSVCVVDGKVVLSCLRSQKDFAPLEMEISDTEDGMQDEETSQAAEGLGPDDDRQKRVLRLENARRWLRRRAAT